VDLLWSQWKNLPEIYRKEKRQALEKFLSVFTTTNATAWNSSWETLNATMGPDFQPLHTAYIEIEKVAEAYEAGFPEPEQKLPAIADIILERVPTNALLFTQTDLFETFLRLRLQEGRRRDVLVLNSSRIMDTSYLDLALKSQGKATARAPEEMGQRVFQEAIKRKQAGDAEFSGLEISGGVVHADGAQILNSLSRLLMKELYAAMPERPVILIPASRPGDATAGFVAMTNASLLFGTGPNGTANGQGLVDGWRKLLEVAAPESKPLHVELAQTINDSIEAAAAVLRSRNQNEAADKLLLLGKERIAGLGKSRLE
jgi:hypothetical protein